MFCDAMQALWLSERRLSGVRGEDVSFGAEQTRQIGTRQVEVQVGLIWLRWCFEVA